jgi:hypothetical protein
LKDKKKIASLSRDVLIFASPEIEEKSASTFVSEAHRSTRNGRGAAMAVALASLASSALASLAAALIAIWMCSRFVLPRIISFAVRRPRDRPRAFVSPEKTRVPSASSTRI